MKPARNVVSRAGDRIARAGHGQPQRIVLGVIALAAAVAIVALVAGARMDAWWAALAVVAVAGSLVLAWMMVRRNQEMAAQLKALRALERSQAQHENAEKMAALGLWSLDLKSSRFDWSDGAFRVFGGNRSGTPTLAAFLEAVHDDDRVRWNDVHRRAVRKGGDARIEYRLRRADGSEAWLRSVAQCVRDAQGEPIRLEGTVQDISGIRAMQRQLAASEAKFRDLTNLSSDWVWETDVHHRLSYLSDSVDSVLGPWARKHMGKRRWENDLPDALPTDWSGLQATLEARRPFENFECSRIDPEGNVHHLSLSGRPVFDERNRFAGYRGTGHEITREKQQRLLLEIDGDIAAIMREQTDPERVITAVIITVCGKLAWLGGLHLVRRQGRASARERWGYQAFTHMAGALPASIALDDNSVEARAWRSGKAVWLRNATAEAEFAQRYRLAEVGAQAAFIAPITDENGEVLSSLLFLGPVGYRGDDFLGQVAAVLSRSLSLYLQRTSAERRLRHASQHDALTNLPNRAFVGQSLEQMLARGRPLALLYIDLDRYKLINDTLGHSAGDKALIEVARRLEGAIPESDIAGRMGGDEFVVILAQPASRAAVEATARAILTAIEQPLILSERAYFLSASIGVAMAPQDGADAPSLIKAADSAMYQVKSEGRNGVRFAVGDGHGSEQVQQFQLAAELPLAMRRGELELFYQPVMDVSTRHVLSVEGLLRWRHPTLGLLLPDRFLPAAEQSNLIREIGFWVVKRAIDDRIELGLDRHDDLAISVNVSARQLAEEGFLENLTGVMQERGFPAHLLQLELTESSFIENTERTVSLINELRRVGVKVVIDNFGTGYASLSYIKNLPVDGLKIDRNFVRGLPGDRGNAAIVQAIVTLAGKLGLQVMAEGVETASELRGLRELHCDVMQGELINGPAPFEQLQDFLDSVPGLRRMHLVPSAGKRAAAG